MRPTGRAAVTALAAVGALAAGPVTVAVATPASTTTTTTTSARTKTAPAKKTPAKKTPAKKTPAPETTATDWELAGAGGALASFAETSRMVKGKTAATVSDLVVQAPIQCTDSSEPAAPIDTEVVTQTIPVAANGSFSSGAITSGNGNTVSGRISGHTVTLSYHHESSAPNSYDDGTEVCDTGTIALKGTPGKRASVKVGAWAGETAKNEPVLLNVVAGGRALQEPPHPPAGGGAQAAIAFGQFSQTCGAGSCSPNSPDLCAFESQTTQFIASNGTIGNAAEVEGDQAVFSGTFAAGKVTGDFTNGAEGCSQVTWSATPG